MSKPSNGSSAIAEDESTKELQTQMEAAAGSKGPRTIKRIHPTQIAAELTDHIDTSLAAQDSEMARNEALLDQIAEQRKSYRFWIEQIKEMDENAAEAEAELESALEAGRFARALMESRRPRKRRATS